jgi:hypothetical protein
MSTERKICTVDNPFCKENDTPGDRWYHPSAKEIDEDYGKGGGVADGDYVKYKCPICGHSWWNELPN